MSETSIIPVSTNPVIAKLQASWSMFAVKRHTRETELQLKAQELLKKLIEPKTIDDVPAAEQALKEVKAGIAEMIESRKEITKILDAVSEKLMIPEKSLTAPLYASQDAIIKVKLEYEKSRKSQQSITDELKSVREKVAVYIADMHAGYLDAGLKLIGDSYGYALTNIEPGGLDEYLSKVLNRVTEANRLMPRPQIRAIAATQQQVDEVISASFNPQSPSWYVNKFRDDLNERFSDFAHAKNNKAQAIQNALADLSDEKQAIDADKQQSTVAAKLESMATPGIVAGPAVKELKKLYKMDMDESQATAVLVMTAFVANLAQASKYLKVTKWFALSIKQMITCLEKIKTEDNNFSYTGLKFIEDAKL